MQILELVQINDDWIWNGRKANLYHRSLRSNILPIRIRVTLTVVNELEEREFRICIPSVLITFSDGDCRGENNYSHLCVKNRTKAGRP